MKSLTIIIPFLNEQAEIEKTVISILETAITNLDILLINDASDDGYNYDIIAHNYHCKYVKHKQRMGVAASRDEGILLSETPYFLLLDGHMRFYDKGWDLALIDLLRNYPRTLFCGQTKTLRKERGEIVVKDTVHYGAYIDEKNMKAMWNQYDTSPHSNLMEIPCVLGAAYSTSKAYWKHLHGLHGLKYYGMDEQLISLKVWREGGRCLLVKNWIVGHIYREGFPYRDLLAERMFNILYVIELFLNYEQKHDLFLYFKNNVQTFKDGLQQLKDGYKTIREEKKYLNSIFNENLYHFKELNQSFIKLNKKKKDELFIIFK